MKTLSIKQPWAFLIASVIKNIENRTWKTNFRGRIYIHASIKKVSYKNWYDSQLTNNQLLALLDYYCTEPERFIYGAIIGEVDIVGCTMNHPSIWAEKDCYNWVLANPVLYDKPILNVKGKLSLWEY